MSFNMGDGPEEDRCSICLCGYPDAEKLSNPRFALPGCGHVFHAQCIVQASLFVKDTDLDIEASGNQLTFTSQRNLACPLCRNIGFCQTIRETKDTGRLPFNFSAFNRLPFNFSAFNPEDEAEEGHEEDDGDEDEDDGAPASVVASARPRRLFPRRPRSVELLSQAQHVDSEGKASSILKRLLRRMDAFTEQKKEAQAQLTCLRRQRWAPLAKVKALKKKVKASRSNALLLKKQIVKRMRDGSEM